MASLPSFPGQSWSQDLGSPPRSDVAPIVGFQAVPRLSALEWSVVALAERDRLSSLREPGPFQLALGKLFGTQRPNGLANERLEALRRIAVLAWRHYWNVPKSELKQFLAAGFSLDQYELIQASIGQARAATARRRGRS